MKIFLTLGLAVCFSPLAGAQNNTQPGQLSPAEVPAKLIPDGTPAQQGVITKQEPTTPAVLAVPEDTFFRPFKPAATAQVTVPVQPGTASAKTVRTNVDPVLALKRQQARELKALRESLKDRPNADKNKAVAAMEADHKAALKELEAANKAEAEKDQKVRSKPAKKANDLMLKP